MSTDFAKAMRKIAEMVCSERLEQHDVPDLLVVSEMQFDQARFEGGYGDYFGYDKVLQRGTPYMRKSRSCSTRWACKCTGAR